MRLSGLANKVFAMKTFALALLVAYFAVNADTKAQNAADNSKQQPTIEDRLGQLEQDQQDLAGRVDALSQKIADLQREVKALEQQGGRSSATAAEPPAGPSNPPNDNSAGESNTTQGASYDVFYDRLQSDGRWFNDETYGYVWEPNVASADQNWRPYTDGRWVYTDRGWTWVSNENFGWAVYHYGRWVRLSETGWVWVPGSKWAPAWVSWRQSDDYVGWAPLPPEAESDQDLKIEGWADSYYNIGPASYVFLKIVDLGNRSYRNVIASPRDPVDFISRTRNVTSIYYGNGGVIDNGPSYEQLVQRSNVKIDRYRLNYVQQNDPKAQFAATARGDQLQVIAPAAQLQRAATVEPQVAGNISKAQVDRGWQGIDEAKAKQLKQTWEKESPVPASLPAKPEPPRPVMARAAGQQSQPAGQQPATEKREQNLPSTTQKSNEQPTNEATTATPSPSPARNEKAAQPVQQQPGLNQQRQESRQAERPETTPPAPSPSPAEKAQQTDRQPPTGNKEVKQGERQRQETSSPSPSLQKERPERGQASPSENRRKESREAERPQPQHTESPASKTDQPDQSEVKPRGQNVEEQAAGSAEDSSEKARMPQKEEKAARNLRNTEEAPAKEEGPRRESSENPRKSNATERPAAGESKGQSRDQSESEKPGGKKRPEEVEKKTPSQPQ
jgi:hypothetical protein